MNDNKSLEKIIKRLDILISLNLDTTLDTKGAPLASKIQRLAELSLTASEIASILGKPLNYVTATLSRKRKSMNDIGDKKND